MNKKNFSVNCDGKEYWISRSIAVLGLVYVITPSKSIYILANKRGIGTPDYQGYWNMPCGYLDYNETCKEACIREIYEETGITVPFVNFWTVSDALTDTKQNVTLRYYCCLDSLLEVNKDDFGGEKNEVEEIRWIKLDDINNYNWAFNHLEIIKEFFKSQL